MVLLFLMMLIFVSNFGRQLIYRLYHSFAAFFFVQLKKKNTHTLTQTHTLLLFGQLIPTCSLGEIVD